MHRSQISLDAAKHAEKKVWLNTYNAADNFLGSTYKPLLEELRGAA